MLAILGKHQQVLKNVSEDIFSFSFLPFSFFWQSPAEIEQTPAAPSTGWAEKTESKAADQGSPGSQATAFPRQGIRGAPEEITPGRNPAPAIGRSAQRKEARPYLRKAALQTKTPLVSPPFFPLTESIPNRFPKGKSPLSKPFKYRPGHIAHEDAARLRKGYLSSPDAGGWGRV